MIIETAGQAQAGADGSARLSLGPRTAVGSWMVTGMSSSVVNSTTEAQLRVYKGYETPSTLVNSSVSANTAVSTQDDIPLSPGDVLLFVWTGAQPGAWCTATVRGEPL